MWKIVVVAVTIVLVAGFAVSGRADRGISAAQEAVPGDLASHPLVGTWIVDTNVDTDTDAPEVGIFSADGTTFGLGAGRWVSGAWQAADEITGAVTLAGVFAANGGGYVVLRGPHQVDDTGNTWTCLCTFTVVAADGTVLDSGMATARGARLPIEPVTAMGTALTGFPTWAPEPLGDATPAS